MTATELSKIAKELNHSFMDGVGNALRSMPTSEFNEIPTFGYTKQELEFIKKYGCVWTTQEGVEVFSLGGQPFKVKFIN